MPKLSDSMADAVIIRWLKQPGDAFARGEGLIEVETDKATVVYEAESDGTLASILAPEGATVAIGDPIATLGNGEQPGSQAPSAPPAAAPVEREPAAPAPLRPPGGERANASPVARRKAVELGVALHDVAGTGPGGRITADDVTRAAEETTVAAPMAATGSALSKGDANVVPLTTTQETIARRMLESATTIPTFTAAIDVDVSRITALREAGRDKGDVPSLNDFVVKAAAGALRAFPRFNASLVDGKVESYSRVNVGIAVATDDALLVPVVHDADRKSLAE